MSESKHTPGPWAIHLAQTVSVRPLNSDTLLARLFGARAKAEANARLIARAPSMLALLKKALPIIEAEADMRGECKESTGYTPLYHTEMRELAEEIAAILQ